ncbi:MAG: thermonuclease family protein [Pseudomonadota bacterium]
MIRFTLLFCLLAWPGAAIVHSADRTIYAGPIPATVVKVRDGDSVDVIAHVWPGHDVRVSIRLRGIDAPELRARCDEERIKAISARDRLQALLASGKARLRDVSGGKYFGRVLSRIEAMDGRDVQSALLSEGLVRPYRGGKRESWCGDDLALR